MSRSLGPDGIKRGTNYDYRALIEQRLQADIAAITDSYAQAEMVAFVSARLDEDADTWQRAADGPRAGPPGVINRQLREVEAKRAILARYTEPPPPNLGESLQRSQEKMGLLYALEQLASVWQDHPDYDEAWRDSTAT
jgi:Family of unknown function (DUF6221)